MKPACVTITYTVYEPNYIPGKSKYTSKIDTFNKAYKQAKKYGFGSEIVRNFHKKHNNGSAEFYSDQRMWTYIDISKIRERKKK